LRTDGKITAFFSKSSKVPRNLCSSVVRGCGPRGQSSNPPDRTRTPYLHAGSSLTNTVFGLFLDDTNRYAILG
jgi:hypothetical protein